MSEIPEGWGKPRIARFEDVSIRLADRIVEREEAERKKPDSSLDELIVFLDRIIDGFPRDWVLHLNSKPYYELQQWARPFHNFLQPGERGFERIGLMTDTFCGYEVVLDDEVIYAEMKEKI